MLPTRLAAMALTTSALLAASGCGGSSKDTSTTASSTTKATAVTATAPPTTPAPKVATGTPLTRAQFIAKANSICTHTNAKRSAIVVVHASEYARELPQAVIYDATETNELSKLVPPDALRHDWSQFLSDFHLYTEYTNTIAKYAQANNLSVGKSLLPAAERIHHRFASIAARDGLTGCVYFS